MLPCAIADRAIFLVFQCKEVLILPDRNGVPHSIAQCKIGSTPNAREKGVEMLSSLARDGHRHAQLSLGQLYGASADLSMQQKGIQLCVLAGKNGISAGWLEAGKLRILFAPTNTLWQSDKLLFFFA
jgi:hypothetical protein